MYYCHTRFYNPLWRRWLTPDTPYYLNQESITGMNLFVYCNNNPVMYVDGEGTFAISTLIIGAVIGAVVGITLSYGSDVISNFKDGFELSDFNTFGDNWQKYVCSAVGGAVSGVFGTFGSVGMSFIGGFAGSMIDSAYTFTSAENVGHALWTSLLAGSLAGIGTAVTNRITSSYFKSQLSNASSKTQHQISVFLKNSKKVPGVNTKAYSILSKTVNVYKIAERATGVIVDLLGLFY